MQAPHNALYGIWLRSASVSGGKDWLIFQVPNGVMTMWGKTGFVNQMSPVKPGKDIYHIAQGKRNKGYEEVATWSQAHGWSHGAQQHSGAQAQATPPVPAPKPTKPRRSSSQKAIAAVQKWTEEAPPEAEWF